MRFAGFAWRSITASGGRMSEALWYAGVCDSMLAKVDSWLRAWPRGEVFATREGWTIEGGKFELVTGRLLYVPFTRPELEHLIRILDSLKPNWTFTAYLKVKLSHFGSFRLMPGNQRLVPMESGDEPLQQTLELLIAAKTGKASLSKELDAVLEQKKDGPLWG